MRYFVSQVNQSPSQAYVMALSAKEVRRLETMARLLEPATSRLLERAGVCARMKVLDVGCGPGDVSLAAASLVGPAGTVVGIDRNPAVLEVARARAEAAGWSNVSFVDGDLTDLHLDTDFDAPAYGLFMHQSHLRPPKCPSMPASPAVSTRPYR